MVTTIIKNLLAPASARYVRQIGMPMIDFVPEISPSAALLATLSSVSGTNRALAQMPHQNLAYANLAAKGRWPAVPRIERFLERRPRWGAKHRSAMSAAAHLDVHSNLQHSMLHRGGT